MIWRCRATPNAYAVCTLYNTTQWNNVKREQNATMIIIFATVKINRKTEHDKPIVTNNLNGCWMIRWHWSCCYGIAIDIVIICDEVAPEERRQTGERKWMKIKRVFIFVTLYFEFDIYLGWKYTCNSHFFTERTLNIITHMCVHCTGCAQHIHMHHRHRQHNTHTQCAKSLWQFFDLAMWMELVWVCARESITKILNPLKLPSLLPTIKPLYALYECILFIYRV